VAESPVAAVRDSPVTVICIRRYENIREILDVPESADVFPGRTVVNLTSGEPFEAIEARSWVEGLGADYLEGHIHSYPGQVGTEGAFLTYAGPREVWSRNEELLSSLAESSTWIGEEITAVNALFVVASAFYHVGLFGLLEATAYARAVGLSSDVVLDVVSRRIRLLEHGIPPTLEAAMTGRYESDQAHVRVTLDAMSMFKHAIAQAGTSTALVSDVLTYLEAADAAGLGSMNPAAAVEIMSGSAGSA
jgi:3-hydroxyisobutyrate dehydrogenase-like beta-hydroxyacid dehydrogenase